MFVSTSGAAFSHSPPLSTIHGALPFCCLEPCHHPKGLLEISEESNVVGDFSNSPPRRGCPFAELSLPVHQLSVSVSALGQHDSARQPRCGRAHEPEALKCIRVYAHRPYLFKGCVSKRFFDTCKHSSLMTVQCPRLKFIQEFQQLYNKSLRFCLESLCK